MKSHACRQLVILSMFFLLYPIYDAIASEPAIQWEKTFGGSSDEKGHSVQQTSDGGYIIAGYTGSYGSGNLDMYLIKTDSSGNLQWQKTFGSTEQEQGWSVFQTTDGGYIIGGGNILIKTNFQGDLQWQKQLNGYCYSMQQTSDGGCIITGYSDGDVCLIKTTSAGSVQWERTFGGSGTDEGWSVQRTNDGGYIVVGHTYSYSSGQDDVYLIKTDSAGNLQWQKNFGGSSWDVGRSVRQTLDGGYIIVGYTYSYGAGNGDVWLIKTNSAGNMQWQKTFGGSSYDNGYCLQITSDGGYIITGFTQSYGSGNWDVWLIKTDSSGNLEWHKPIGGTSQEEGWSVQQTADSGYVIAGTTQSYGAGGRDVYLIKLSPDVTPQTVTIRGTIYDAASGEPIADANVSSGALLVKTDTSGHYELTGLRPGQITVKTEKAGYKSQTSIIADTEPGQSYPLNFYLEPEPIIGVMLGGAVSEKLFTDINWRNNYAEKVLIPALQMLGRDAPGTYIKFFVPWGDRKNVNGSLDRGWASRHLNYTAYLEDYNTMVFDGLTEEQVNELIEKYCYGDAINLDPSANWRDLRWLMNLIKKYSLKPYPILGNGGFTPATQVGGLLPNNMNQYMAQLYIHARAVVRMCLNGEMPGGNNIPIWQIENEINYASAHANVLMQWRQPCGSYWGDPDIQEAIIATLRNAIRDEYYSQGKQQPLVAIDLHVGYEGGDFTGIGAIPFYQSAKRLSKYSDLIALNDYAFCVRPLSGKTRSAISAASTRLRELAARIKIEGVDTPHAFAGETTFPSEASGIYKGNPNFSEYTQTVYLKEYFKSYKDAKNYDSSLVPDVPIFLVSDCRF
jgi:hypothetical protein